MKRMRLLAVLLAGSVALGTVACSGGEGTDPGDPEGPPIARQEEPQVPPIAVPAEDLMALVDGNNQFAIELYKKLAATTDGNIVLSPYSISSALAMTYAGARGETAEEMAKTLHFTLPPDRLHPAFGGTTQQFQSGRDKSYRLNIANALWGQQGFPFLPEFLGLTRRNYGGGFREVDFRRDPEGSRQAINHWVKERTEERIPELLHKEDVGPGVLLVLTNAIYFKGEWERAFPGGQTRDEAFESAPGVRTNVPMMRSGPGLFRYHSTPQYQLLELPYRGNRVSMVFLLPGKRFGLPEVEKTFTADELTSSLAQLGERHGTIDVPRFKGRSRFDPEMRASLMELGMPLAFSDNADFTGITRHGLRISKVIHEADIEVDEHGTTATAATAVIMGRSVGFTFRADHPFLFLIRDRETGTILFLGRVTTPN